MKKIYVTIEMEFGSDYQHEVGRSLLEITLKSMKQYSEDGHKQNKVTYKIVGTEEGGQV